ncbi:hypothetical protein CHS0354_023013 [Potamilus streckersoni]|uniref:Protocadherin-20 n=1 Tax=Potamilus streckersoni TaxID=2493646 RepID=A0AAE0SUK6_9BIVA|nr:hypothetical protein CHS0354_023013 [Potamilus streckersoni]
MEKKIYFPKMGKNNIYVIFIFIFECLCQEIEYSILEGKEAGTFIGNIRTDANLRSYVDQQNFEQLRYNFLNQDDPQVKYFNISEQNGDIFTASVLDREEMCKFSSTCIFLFTVAAQSSIGPFFKKISFTVIVEDVNDNTPTFTSSSVFVSFSESVVVGTFVTVAGAVDEDSANFSVVRYEILPLSSPFSAEFSKILDGSSVVRIIVKSMLDRETKDNYQLQLVAIDGGDPPKSGILLVNVTVSDVNDNPPIFSSSVYNVTVKEDIAINSTILRVTATDLDAGYNGKIVYRLSPNQAEEIKRLFSVDTTNGDIRILQNLFFSAAGMYKIIIEASDLGVQPYTTQTLMQVYIEDVKNHSPRISVNLLSSGFYAKISEYANNGAVVALIDVSDDDKDRNGIVNCSIASELFQLQRLEVNEYKVIVSRSLDREKQDSHQVTVHCQDMGTPPLNSTENFTVKVLDENDNSPVFSKYVYEASITENNKVNAVVTQVHAEDQDIGLNGQISYVLYPDASKTFRVDSNGLISAKVSLDRETKDYYRVEVFAFDGGSPSLTSSATIIVTINDTNDNVPEFIQSYYEFEIEENQPVDIFVGEVSAVDRDLSLNGVVSYYLNSDTQGDLPFVLLPDGKLKTKGRLDREVQSFYYFLVTAIDQGTPKRLYSSVNVTVKIKDINDNVPLITSPPNNSDFILHVICFTPVHTMIYQIIAHDVDEGENARLIFQVVGRNDSSIFDVDNSGQIFVSRKMTELDANLYCLNISVSDYGLPPQQVVLQLHLDVTARNENQSSVAQVGDDLNNQNLLIVLSVVLITAVFAATILVTICVIRYLDRRKPRFMDSDTSSNQSGDIAVVTGLAIDAKKILNISLSRDSSIITSAFPNNQFLPRCNSNDQEKYDDQSSRNLSNLADGDNIGSLQLRAVTSEDPDASQLHRLASLRIQQALLKSHENPWKNKNPNSPETTLEKKHGDNHSEMSADTGGTYDSGRGGSVSDLQSNMGMSHDSDDSRILQLQNTVCQSGRRGLPPHRNQSKSSNKMLPRKPVCTSPRCKNGLGIQMGLSSISLNNYRSQSQYNSSPVKEDSMDFREQITSVIDRSELRGHCVSPSSINEIEDQSEIVPTYSLMHSNELPQECLNKFKYIVTNTRDPSYKSDSLRKNRGDIPTNNRERNYYPCNYHVDMNDTMDSMATTFDDDDNTTTSGSYTIDNTYDDFLEELNVTKFRDVLV